MPSHYSINDLERLTGIKAHTLRIWEQRYNILHPNRTKTNIRFYSNADLKRILNISLLNNHGYKISKIAVLSDEEIVKEAEKLLNSFEREDDQVEKLVLCLTEMNELRFEKVYASAIDRFGFENTFEKIIFPFLSHVSNMWQIGVIGSAHEHFISNLIRQKMITAIDGVKPRVINDPQTILLFLPYGEYNEIGLLYSHYLVKSAGHRSYYIGQSISPEELESVFINLKPDQVINMITARIADMSLTDYFCLLKKKMAPAVFLIGGKYALTGEGGVKLPKNFKLLSDYSELKKLL